MRVLAALALFALVGCNEHRHVGKAKTTGQTAAYIEQTIMHDAVLPKGAANIQDMGNGWMLFECEVGGEPKRFLYARHYTKEGYTTATITQVQ